MKKNSLFSWSSIFFYFAVFCFIAINCPHRPRVIITGDPADSYAPAIETEFTCDWHSALYLKECILLKRLLQLFGWDLSGLEVLYVVWYITATILYIQLCYVFRVVKEYFNLGCVFDVASSLFILFNLRGLTCFLIIDFVFAAVFISSIIILYFISKYRHSKYGLVLCLVLFVLLLYQMIEVRKNAAILLPFMFGVGMLIVCPKIKKYVLITSSVVLSSFFWITSNFLTQYLFSDQKTYPASVMMMSDMCVAAALRQEPENMKKEIEEKTGYHLRPLNIYKQFHACIPYFPSFPVNEYNKSNWDSLKEIYIKEWIDNYDTMIAARTLQIIQFYLHGYTPSIIVNFYESTYGLNGKMREECSHLEWKVIAWIVTMCITCLYTICLAVAFCRGHRLSAPRKATLIVCLLMLIYALSFVLVTPTFDSRYKVMCTLVACYASGIALAELYKRVLR